MPKSVFLAPWFQHSFCVKFIYTTGCDQSKVHSFAASELCDWIARLPMAKGPKTTPSSNKREKSAQRKIREWILIYR